MGDLEEMRQEVGHVTAAMTVIQGRSGQVDDVQRRLAQLRYLIYNTFDRKLDTLGIKEFFDGGFQDPLKLFDGFYISDTANVLGTGADVPELVFSGSLAAAATYSAIVFAGAIPLWLFNSFAAVIRGTGNMFFPAVVVTVGGVASPPATLTVLPAPGK